jgi:hypothetical protein
MSLSTGATLMLTSMRKRGSPWAGFNAMTNAIGLAGRRPSARFKGSETLLGVGILVGGIFVMSVAQEAALARWPKHRKLLSPVLVSAGGYLIDRYLLPKNMVSGLKRSLGPLGTVAKYTVLGLSAAFPTDSSSVRSRVLRAVGA